MICLDCLYYDEIILRLSIRMDCKDVVEVLNDLSEENKKLQGKYDKQLWLYNGLGCVYDWLKEENEQLKQRNENQYQQLNKLWGLIQAKDWETLTAMDNQMKEDEERLQRESGTYGDVE